MKYKYWNEYRNQLLNVWIKDTELEASANEGVASASEMVALIATLIFTLKSFERGKVEGQLEP